jgi:hypothetical protein
MKHILILTALALAAIFFAACGGDDDNTKTAAPTATHAASTNAGGSSATVVSNGGGEPVEPTENGGETTAPTQNNGGGDTLDVCSLLTKDEVEAAIGEDMTDGFVSDPSEEKPQCQWDPVDPSTASTVYLSVELGPGAASDYDALSSIAEPVDGIGDKAQWTGGLKILDVLTDNREVTVQAVYFKDDKDPKEIAISLARLAMGRLP